MSKEELLKIIYGKDDVDTYKRFQEIEKISINSNILYKYLDDLLKVLSEDKSYIRVKGFRLICILSKYDSNKIIDKNINYILSVLDDDKPTSIRQYLKYLVCIINNKNELKDTILSKVNSINFSKFKDSMSSLIKKDIDLINNNTNIS